MSDPYNITVTMTEEEFAFRQRAKEAGIPALIVSMYAHVLRKLVEDEREACAKVCEDSVEYAGDTLAQAIRARGQA